MNEKSDNDIAEDLVSIALGHARIAFSKQSGEREAYLQQCRRNWQADAFVVSGNQAGSERYSEGPIGRRESCYWRCSSEERIQPGTPDDAAGPPERMHSAIAPVLPASCRSRRRPECMSVDKRH